MCGGKPQPEPAEYAKPFVRSQSSPTVQSGCEEFFRTEAERNPVMQRERNRSGKRVRSFPPDLITPAKTSNPRIKLCGSLGGAGGLGSGKRARGKSSCHADKSWRLCADRLYEGMNATVAIFVVSLCKNRGYLGAFRGTECVRGLQG
jgi:hypothetical protein